MSCVDVVIFETNDQFCERKYLVKTNLCVVKFPIVYFNLLFFVNICVLGCSSLIVSLCDVHICS